MHTENSNQKGSYTTLPQSSTKHTYIKLQIGHTAYVLGDTYVAWLLKGDMVNNQ